MLLVLGTLLVVALAAAIYLVESNIRVLPEKRAATPEDLAMELADSTHSAWEVAGVVARGGVRLDSWLFLPKGTELRGAVIVLHGYASTRRSMMDRARLLLELGYVVLLPDLRAHGTSGGELVSFGQHEVHDVAAWREYLARRFPDEPIFGLGQSMGAAVLLEAVRSGVQLEGLIAECAYTSFPEVATERLADRYHLPLAFASAALRIPMELGMAYCRLRYGIGLRAIRPLETIREVRLRVLLIHGSLDSTIFPRHSRWLHAANRSGTDLWIVEGAGHTTCLATEPDEYRRRVAEWFISPRAASRASVQPSGPSW